MKTLFLIRHSKSDWANDELADVDRPLNERGYRDAHAMGGRLKERKDIPDLVMSSDAVRAASTAMILMREMDLNSSRLKIERAMYEAPAEQLLKIVRGIDDRYEKVFFVCHNPGITNLVNRICNASIDNVPTTGVLCIDIPFDSWKGAGLEDGTLRYFDFPKKKD
ncbi:MAG TPA: histidine phosphatase family protein [Bacteroidia bacterium]|jgi:phosphohistidine phosphatase